MEIVGLSEQDATGWKLGLYRDVERTFRTPVVNAIVRVPMAAAPELVRYTWGQVKPVFETRAFGEYADEYRRELVEPVEESFDLPTYTPGDLGMGPGEFRELRGQTVAQDVVYPRLEVMIELLDRGFHGEPIGHEPDQREAATGPLGDGPESDLLRSPTLLDFEDVPGELDDLVPRLQSHHGFDDGLPTLHRCLAQWPAFLETAWEELQPVLASDAYDRGTDRAYARAAEFVDSVPYRPRIAPDDLRAVGADESDVEQLQELADAFARGPPRSVFRTIPLYASLIDARVNA